MKEYLTISICEDGWKTERKLNEYAKEGWKLVCSYARKNEWLILEREKEVCSKCNK